MLGNQNAPTTYKYLCLKCNNVIVTRQHVLPKRCSNCGEDVFEEIENKREIIQK